MGEGLRWAVWALTSLLLADTLPVPVLTAVFPGHLSQRAVREPKPERHHRPHAAPLHHHQGPLPGAGRLPLRAGDGRGGGCTEQQRFLPRSQVAFNRVARGMLHQDHITFAMLLARIKLKGAVG